MRVFAEERYFPHKAQRSSLSRGCRVALKYTSSLIISENKSDLQNMEIDPFT